MKATEREISEDQLARAVNWFTSKMHPECFSDFCETGDGEYTPYANDRPAIDIEGVKL